MKNKTRLLCYSLLSSLTLLLVGCADAGQDQVVKSDAIITLQGNASTASAGGTITEYQWRQIAGTDLNIQDQNESNISFTAPSVEIETMLLFRLTTIEKGGDPDLFVSHDIVQIIVQPNEGKDTTAPDITLSGKQTITLYLGDMYIEYGAKAKDNVEGSLDVNITGTVDTDTVGSYVVTYTATDSSGNTKRIERTVIVREQEDSAQDNNSTFEKGLYGTISLTKEWTIPQDAIFLDIRADWERIESRPKGAIGGPKYEYGNPDFVANVRQLLEDHSNKQLILICHSASRSSRAAALLSNDGMSNVWQIEGGMVKWKDIKPDEVLTGPL